MKKHYFLIYSLLCFGIGVANAQNIYTIAGNGTGGYSGDGGLATAAEINAPSGVAIDASGNVYIAEQGNYRIRKVNTSGIISTFAGNGTLGYSGDGGLATAAEINAPNDIAIDASGNVYFAEYGNSCIRKVNTSGIISTFAGNGTGGYSGDGGLATAAEINRPIGIAIDGAGNVYIGDYYNDRIRIVNTSGIISTLAGNGVFGFSGDGGLATAAELYGPLGVAIDASGNVYIADQTNTRIRKVNASGIISTFAGNGILGYSGDGGLATAAEIYYPHGVKVDASGNVYIDDYNNQRIRIVNTSGIISTIAGNGTGGYSGDGGLATAAEINNPYDIVIDASDNVYIADIGNNRIREVTNGSPLVVNELYPLQNVIVYPNPNHGTFTISMENIKNKAQIDIYNVLGEMVCNSTVNTNTIQINMNIQAKGIYLYRILTENGTLISSGKFIVE